MLLVGLAAMIAPGSAVTAPSPQQPGPFQLSPFPYPVKARQARETGRVVVTLSFDAEGKATGCAVKVSSGFARLDEGTCKGAVKAVRYLPKADPDRTAVPGKVDLPVNWRLD